MIMGGGAGQKEVGKDDADRRGEGRLAQLHAKGGLGITLAQGRPPFGRSGPAAAGWLAAAWLLDTIW